MRFANFIRLEIDRNALYDMDLWRPFFIPALFPPCGRGGSGGAVPGKRSEEGMRSRRAGASDAAGGRTAAQGAGRMRDGTKRRVQRNRMRDGRVRNP